MMVVRTGIVALVALLLAASPLAAQGNEAQLRLTVIDQTGASLPSAHVRVTNAAGLAREADVDERGQTTLAALPIGPVQLQVEARGFAPYSATVTLRRGANNQTVTLYIAGVQEEVVVTEAAVGDTRGNALTTTLEEGEIAELSDDPDELRAQLEAMTGGAGAIFNVNGFRGGRLPNRDEIRQIRFRTNSFSADNHDAGRVQVDIITRPGLTEWSGNANFGLRNDVLNARNAFARTETPEQFRRFTAGLRGPIVRNRTSLRFNVDGNRSFDSTTIVALRPEARIADQVKRPFEQTNVTAGLEHGLTASQTLRLEYRRNEDERRNLGVGNFNLMERAFSRASTEHQVRTSVQSIFGRRALNELRVQWNFQENASRSVSEAPAVVVIDAFSSGGAGVASEGSTRTLEIADDFDFNVGRRHAMRAGLLFEAGAYRNFDARNAAGTFTFSSLEAFLAGRPNTFTQRLGELRTAFSQYQLGVYWQDDFRVNRALSLSIGVREELQTNVGDAMNLMPRFGFTFTPRRARLTVRGGYGIFHDWYEADLHDQTLRVTGGPDAQRDLLILNPGYPDPTGGVAATMLGGGRVQAAPDLRMPYVHQASIGIERPITQTLTFQTSYNRIRGRNQLRSRDVNAPDAFGVRREPTVGTVAQIESTGRSASDRINANLFYRVPQRRMFMGANYTWAKVRTHADNPLSLPADSHHPDAEWGPSAQDVRHRFNAMINGGLPLGIRASVNGVAQSAPPYTIITGGDDNRDGVTNDRPAGVGRNSVRSAARFDLNVRFTRGFGFGGPREGGPRGPGGGGPVVIAGGPGGGPGGPGGPGGGGGGFFGPGGNDDSRFRVEFYVQGFNVLNRTNFLNFSGNLQSPFFGTPTSAAQARRVEVGMQFRF
ncbi:MAG: TonB-dependent receptor [Acidobacteria bacterium]|nr:TonB-dependent receptor [Acidobacteriota bacterium]